MKLLKFQGFLCGIPGRNRTANYALGEHCYIHLTTETYQVLQGLRGEMDRLESALLKHTIKSTVHTSESEYRGSRVYPKSVISLINRGSLIHLTTETYQSAQGRDISYVNILPQKRQKE